MAELAYVGKIVPIPSMSDGLPYQHPGKKKKTRWFDYLAHLSFFLLDFTTPQPTGLTGLKMGTFIHIIIN
jgi:hypothetical protein